MKKFSKVISSVICLSVAFSACGCGDIIGPKPQPSGSGGLGRLYKIEVAVNNAGFGIDWAHTLANEYNQLNANSDYEIVIKDYGMRYAEGVLGDLAAGSGYDMYINEGSEITKGIYEDYFEDISDILDDSIDGDGTIQEKIINFDLWKNNYSKHGEGLYALPYSNGVCGMIIDHQEFIDNGWYCFEDKENKILTVGKDGKRGTYDDGQPQTLEEFNNMLERIVVSAKPFIYGSGVVAYLDYIYNSIFAQYAGVEDYSTFYTYDSNGREVKLVNGSTTAITLDTGYKVYEMEALTKAYQIFDSWFDYTSGVAGDYVHPTCKGTSASQYDAQNLFLLGYKGAASNPESAILIDGIWWENEAKAMFNALDNVNRGLGDREYRMLLLPTFDGQKDTKSCLSVTAAGTMSIPKTNDKERLAVIKDFAKFLIKDESLRTSTRMTGNVLGYKYEMTPEDEAKMTPFQKNVLQMYADQENVRIVSQALDRISSPLSHSSVKGKENLFGPIKDGITLPYCLDAVKRLSVAEITTGLKNKYSADVWATYVTQAKNSGFFVD